MAKFEAREEEAQVADYRAFFDSSCLRVWHLDGKEKTFRIVRVTGLVTEMVTGGKKETKKQPKLDLETQAGKPIPLPLLLNKTNAGTIAQLYGNRPSGWVGKLITLYPTETQVGRETKDCIRVRNKIPVGKNARPEPQPAAAHDPEQAERQPGDDEEPPFGALESDHVQ